MNKLFNVWSADLIPVDIKNELDKNGKKVVYPSAWKNGEIYKTLSKNSVALRTGQQSVNVLDVDTKDLEQLTEPFKSWVDDRLMFGDTLTVETKNGYHFYFTANFKVKTTAKKDRDGVEIPFIDFRGEGGLIFVHSDSDAANYEVICDNIPTDATLEINSSIPRFTENVVIIDDEVCFENLDDEDDISVLKVGNKHTLAEVTDILNKTSSDVPRDEWLGLMASAYNLIDTEPERLEEVLLKWSQTATNFSDQGFNTAWSEIHSGRFGKAFKGGTLIKGANEQEAIRVIEEFEQKISVVKKVSEIKDIIEALTHISDLQTNTDSDTEVRVSLSKTLNMKYKDLAAASKNTNKKTKVVQARAIAKQIQYAPTLEELEASNALVDMSAYYVGSKYLVRVGNKLSDEFAYSSAITHCKLQGIGESVAQAYLENADVVSSVHIGANYNIDNYVTYKLEESSSAHIHDVLNVYTNPIFKLKRVLTDTYDEKIITDFFDNIWQGKALELVKLIALSIRFSANKKNQLMLVTPTSFGKTAMMKHLGFGEIGMETLLGAFQGDGIGSEVLSPIQSSGLMLINEVDTALPKRLKELENEMQVKEFGSGGGTRNVGLHFVVLTSTHDTAILKASDEVSERTMFMQLHGEDSKYNLTSSPIFNADRELYTAVIRNEMINQFLYYVYEADVTKNVLYTLQDQYKLHPSEDLHLLSQDIFCTVVKAIKTGGYGSQNSRNEWVVSKKRDIRDLIEAELLDHGEIDVGKQVSIITAQLYSGVKRKSDGVTQYVVNTEVPVTNMFDDLDIEGL